MSTPEIFQLNERKVKKSNYTNNSVAKVILKTKQINMLSNLNFSN